MTRLIGCITLFAAVCACADTERAATPAAAAYGLADSPPGRRATPLPPYSARKSLLVDRVDEALGRYEKERWERFVDSVDVGERSKDLRLTQQAIDEGKWKIEWLFLNGDELFEHEFGTDEGFGPGLRRVHSGASGGPDALSCSECHHRGGFDGAGDRSQNAFFDGDGADPASAFERNAPHTLGLGAVERLAAEMTSDLQAQKQVAVESARALGKPWTAALTSKGIHFGELRARADGSLDTTAVSGVDADLVIKPFGWKGSLATLREFAADGFQRHHGVQFSPQDAVGAKADPDGDGYWYEISEGMLTSIVTYLSLLEVPVMIPPEDPVLLSRHAAGTAAFHEIGCATCHVPSLPLHESKIVIARSLTADLLVDAEEPRIATDLNGRLTPIDVFLYSDLKRHPIGEQLSEGRPTDKGVPGDVFLTRPLWGLADTAPYLHDGRAATLDEAILLHGGEARAARDRYAALSPARQGDVRIFLMSLTRFPRIEMR